MCYCLLKGWNQASPEERQSKLRDLLNSFMNIKLIRSNSQLHNPENLALQMLLPTTFQVSYTTAENNRSYDESLCDDNTSQSPISTVANRQYNYLQKMEGYLQKQEEDLLRTLELVHVSGVMHEIV